MADARSGRGKERLRLRLYQHGWRVNSYVLLGFGFLPCLLFWLLLNNVPCAAEPIDVNKIHPVVRKVLAEKIEDIIKEMHDLSFARRSQGINYFEWRKADGSASH
jgi:hypothetical protein